MTLSWTTLSQTEICPETGLSLLQMLSQGWVRAELIEKTTAKKGNFFTSRTLFKKRGCEIVTIVKLTAYCTYWSGQRWVILIKQIAFMILKRQQLFYLLIMMGWNDKKLLIRKTYDTVPHSPHKESKYCQAVRPSVSQACFFMTVALPPSLP